MGVALDTYERHPHKYSEKKEETLKVLREASKESHEQFMRYRSEVGLPEPATRRREWEEAAPPA